MKIEIYEDYIIFVNKNNKLHRLDGPAVIHVNGTKYWYINGKRYSEKEYNIKIAEMNINL